MVDFVEGLEDWGIKEAVNAALASLVSNGTITVANEAAVDQASITIANVIIQIIATKVGAVPPSS